MPYENNYQGENQNGVYSKRLKAGKRRTYFFDIKTTKANDYFLTITESKKRFDDNGYERHKIFLYKEDFNKFIDALAEVTDHVKTELLPDYDFDQFSHDGEYQDPATVETESTDNQTSDTKTEESSEVENVETDVEADVEADVENEEAPSVNEQVEKW